MSISIPKPITDLLTRKDYTAAGDELARSNLPFPEVFRLLSNCTPVLKCYLHKKATFDSGSPSQQQLICHLYLQTALSSISSLKPETRSNFDSTGSYAREIAQIRSFIQSHKSHLSQKVVMKLINDSGESQIFANEALQAFEDYSGVVDHLLFANAHTEVTKFVGSLTDPLVQRQVLCVLYRRNTMVLTEYLSQSAPPMDAVFDSFTEFALNAPMLGRGLRENISTNFSEFFETHRFHQRAHFHIYFIFMALLGAAAPLKKFLDAPEFAEMDADFIAAFLVARGLFALAGEVYARVPARHVLAVKYAMRESFECALALLQGPLRGAEDARLCWLVVARQGGCDWAKLIKAGCGSKCVTLDDIFPYLPPTMELHKLIEAVATEVERSSAEMRAGEVVREAIEGRADEQRVLVEEGGKAVRFDTARECFVCRRTACDAEFDAFPCGHAVHVACWKMRGGREEGLEESCPACGAASLLLFDLPFVDTVKDAELADVWRVPN